MASFSIPDIPPKAELTPGTVDTSSGKALSPHTGTVVFSVNNTTDETLEGKLSVRSEGDAKPEWFSIEGEPQRDFGAKTSGTVNVKISVPAETKSGEYSFRLLVAEESDPDNDYEISQSTAFTVPPAGKVGGTAKKSKWWLWVLIGLVVLAIIGGVVWFLTREKKPPTEPPKVEATTAAVPDLVGKKLAEAKDLSADFDLTPVEGQAEGKEPNTIIRQLPEAGSTQNKGIPLKVTYDPGVVVPAELIGKTAEQSINILNRAGLHVQDTRTACRSSGTDGQIVETTPAVNSRVAKNTGVTVQVAVVGGTIGTRRFACGVLIQDLQVLRVPVAEATFRPIERATFAPKISQ